MARKPRLYLPDCPQHIIQRGNNREVCFYSEGDYKFYLELLLNASTKYGVAVHAFVLMTNHVHLLATPEAKDSISRMMQAVGRSYVGYVNYTYKRTGTLWEGRYKSTLVDSDNYFLTVSRYIELNPVRAKMVEHAGQYPWCSYRANAMGKAIKLITPHKLYLALGPTPSTRLSAYRALFKGRMTERQLDDIRECTNKGWVLGSERFKAQIEHAMAQRASPKSRGGDRKSAEFKKFNSLGG